MSRKKNDDRGFEIRYRDREQAQRRAYNDWLYDQASAEVGVCPVCGNKMRVLPAIGIPPVFDAGCSIQCWQEDPKGYLAKVGADVPVV